MQDNNLTARLPLNYTNISALLNEKIERSEYTGGTTSSATVHVDNNLNIITVDATPDYSAISQEVERLLNTRLEELDVDDPVLEHKFVSSVSLHNGRIVVNHSGVLIEDISGLQSAIDEKLDNLTFTDEYQALSNPVATKSYVDNKVGVETQARKEAIKSLDFDELTLQQNETVSSISETDGIINVEKQSILIAESQVTGLLQDLEDEATARLTADTNITTALLNEVTRATNAEAQLENSLATEIDRVEGLISTEASTRAQADNSLQELINTKLPIVSDLETIRSNAQAGKDHSEITSGNPHQVTKAEVGLGNVDNTSDIDKPISTATLNAITAETERALAAEEALQQNIDSEVSRATSAESNLSLTISDEVTRATGVEQTLQSSITSEANTRSSEITRVEGLVATEASARTTADNELQEQIDAIESKTDVVDIVASKAELDAYDTSKIYNNDVVKVLTDETKDNAISYYRWVKSEGQIGSWLYLGSLGPFYTKAETDTQITNKINTLDNSGQAASTGEVISAVSQSDGVISVSKKTLVEADIPTLSQSKITGVSEHTSNTDMHTTSTEKSNWDAKYDKPSSGIPKTDLASSVLTSLGKADTALQAADISGKLDKVSTFNKVYGTDASGNQTTYDKNSFGQVDDVKVDGTSIVSNKVANIDLTGKADAVHTHTTSLITDFPSTDELLSDLPEYSSAPLDSTKLIRRDLSGLANWGLITFLSLWNYIKGKADSIYATITHTHAISDVTDLQSTLNAKENTSNKVTSISASSTDTQYPSAKAVYSSLSTKLSDAPSDNKQYARKNGTWSEVEASEELKIAPGNNVLITEGTGALAGYKVISATDTTYENKSASLSGTDVSLVTTGEKYTWSNKQDTLVSGTNIKTINGSSVLGSGDLEVSVDNIYKGPSAPTDTSKLWIDTNDTSTQTMSVVGVSATGTSTDEVNYITINGVEKKIGGSGGGITSDVWTVVLDKDSWESAEGKYSQTVNTEGMKSTYILMGWMDNPTESQSKAYSDFEEVKSLSDDTVTVISKSLPAIDVAIKVRQIGNTQSSSSILSAFFDADEWTLIEGKYTQTADVAGIDKDLSLTSWIDDPTDSELAAYAEIEDISSSANNTLTIIASSLPSVDLTIKIKQ